MTRKLMVCICTVYFVAFAFPAVLFAEKVGVFFDSKVPQISFAADDVKTALESKGFQVEMNELSTLKPGYSYKKIVISPASDKNIINVLAVEGGTAPKGLGEQAYSIFTTSQKQTSYWVFGGDSNGVMYGGLQFAENITFDVL